MLDNSKYKSKIQAETTSTKHNLTQLSSSVARSTQSLNNNPNHQHIYHQDLILKRMNSNAMGMGPAPMKFVPTTSSYGTVLQNKVQTKQVSYSNALPLEAGVLKNKTALGNPHYSFTSSAYSPSIMSSTFYDEKENVNMYSNLSVSLPSGPPVYNPKVIEVNNIIQLSGQSNTPPVFVNNNLFSSYSTPTISNDPNTSFEMPPIFDDGSKPPYSYATLISMAIFSSAEKKLTLAEIYQWISQKFLWYQTRDAWRNSIRHNLSLNKAFQKEVRPKGAPGKGNYWCVKPGYEFQFMSKIQSFSKPSSLSTPNSSNTASESLPSTKPLLKEKSQTNDDEKSDELSSSSKGIKEEIPQMMSFSRKRGLDGKLPFVNKRRCSQLSHIPMLGNGFSYESSLSVNSPNKLWFTSIENNMDNAHVIYNNSIVIRSPVRNTHDSELMLSKGLVVTPGRATFDVSLMENTTTPSRFKNLGSIFSPVSFEYEDIYPYSSLKLSPSKNKFDIHEDEETKSCYSSKEGLLSEKNTSVNKKLSSSLPGDECVIGDDSKTDKSTIKNGESSTKNTALTCKIDLKNDKEHQDNDSTENGNDRNESNDN